LGLDIVAEGVETEEQRRILLEQGCDLAQGYLFSRPLPAEQFAVWLIRHSQEEAASNLFPLKRVSDEQPLLRKVSAGSLVVPTELRSFRRR